MKSNNIIHKVQTLQKEIHSREIKYGFNVPYKAWREAYITDESEPGKEPSFKCSGKPKTIYSGRFCAVSGFIFAIVNGKYSLLANLRGPGTPDYQGCWNAPCGYLENCENSKQGIQREIFEECAFIIDTKDIKIVDVETEPEECNNGNVTIRHRAFLGKINPFVIKQYTGGEENEVDAIKWIPVDDIEKYNWAFNHKTVIKKYAPNKFVRKFLELIYRLVSLNKEYSGE